MLAGATIAVLLAGTGPIAYIRKFSIVAQEAAHEDFCHSGHGRQRTHIRAGN